MATLFFGNWSSPRKNCRPKSSLDTVLLEIWAFHCLPFFWTNHEIEKQEKCLKRQRTIKVNLCCKISKIIVIFNYRRPSEVNEVLNWIYSGIQIILSYRDLSKLKMENREENSDNPPWTDENSRKAFDDNFGLPKKQMLAKPLTRANNLPDIFCFLFCQKL